MADQVLLTTAITNLIPEIENRFIRPFTLMVKDKITSSQFHVLLCLKTNFPITMSDLAEYLNISRPQLTCIVETLVHLNYIKRLSDPLDRRKITVCLTNKGSDFLAEIQNNIETYVNRKLSSFNNNEKELLYKSIETFYTLITKNNNTAG